MPMIEIMSPLSDTWVPPSFNVVGEDDLPREVKVVIDPKTGKAVQVVTVGDYDIRVQYRETGSSGGFVAGTGATTFNGDGTWTCPLTLTAGKAYDIMASLYKAGADTGEYDAVSNVNVGLTPVIAIDPGTIPGPGPAPPAAALAAGPAPAPTGTYDPRKGNLIFVQLVRFDFDRMAGGKKLKKRARVAASYHTATNPSSGTWHLWDSFNAMPIGTVPRPQGKERTFVVIATLVTSANWTAVGSASQVIRR